MIRLPIRAALASALAAAGVPACSPEAGSLGTDSAAAPGSAGGPVVKGPSGRSYLTLQAAVDAEGVTGEYTLTGEPIRETVRIVGPGTRCDTGDLGDLRLVGAGSGRVDWSAPEVAQDEPRALLYAEGVRLRVEGVRFSGGTGEGTDCSGGDCRGRDGGAIFAVESILDIVDSELCNNSADLGGAIALWLRDYSDASEACTVTLDSSSVTRNTARSWGAGVVARSVSSLDSDWGTDESDNVVDDVALYSFAGVAPEIYYGYGAHSTFTCSGITGLCEPGP